MLQDTAYINTFQEITSEKAGMILIDFYQTFLNNTFIKEQLTNWD